MRKQAQVPHNQGSLFRKGRKTKAWEAAKRKLKIAFERNGITLCELCGSRFALSFAHSKRRREIVGDEIYECALLCARCHQDADNHGNERMAEIVREIISARRVPIVL